MKKKKQGVPAAVKKQSFKAYMKGHYDLYLLLLPAILYTAVFLYIPMYGVLMAFQDYSPVKGIIGSNFVGLKHFKKFFRRDREPILSFASQITDRLATPEHRTGR